MSELEIPDDVSRLAGTLAAVLIDQGEDGQVVADAVLANMCPRITVAKLRAIITDLSAVREQEVKFAFEVAKQLDEIHPPVGDQRHAILSDAKGRIDGLRICLDMLTKEADELDPEGRTR